ncbi:MAG: hypothetical protein GMKNLPBB_03213 [Myxococcota bacterium]|nr:hypothetical protein [Myxococcota bacterium]
MFQQMAADPRTAWIFQTYAFLLGAIVGSFLNVVIHRLPLGKSVVSPPSSCPKCGHRIRWYENIPLISWVALRGKCSNCKTPISPRYPMVELLTGLLSLAVYQLPIPLADRLALWIFVLNLVAITFIDFDHMIIPPQLSIGGAVVGFASSFFTGTVSWQSSLAGALGGFAVLFGFTWFYGIITNKVGMGGGDFFMFGMIGSFLGAYPALPAIILLAVLQGSVAGGARYLWAWGTGQIAEYERQMAAAPPPPPKKEGADEDDDGEWIEVPEWQLIPFGPFLALGALEYLFFGRTLIDWYMNASRWLVDRVL